MLKYLSKEITLKTQTEIIKEKTMWHSLSKEDVLKKIDSSEKGLSTIQAQERISLHGQNVLPKKKPK